MMSCGGGAEPDFEQGIAVGWGRPSNAEVGCSVHHQPSKSALVLLLESRALNRRAAERRDAAERRAADRRAAERRDVVPLSRPAIEGSYSGNETTPRCDDSH